MSSPFDSLLMILVLCVGLLFLLFRKRMAGIAVRQHKALSGRRLSERSFEVWFGIGGVFFMVFAILGLLGVIQERHSVPR